MLLPVHSRRTETLTFLQPDMLKFGFAAAVTQGPLSRPYAVPPPTGKESDYSDRT